MSPGSIERAISFRRFLGEEIELFLRREGLGFEDAVAAIGELVIALARYREEGTPLFPEVFLCEDVDRAVACVGGLDATMLGRTSLDGEGVRRALKRTAPLSGMGWSVLLRVERATNELAYGLVRIDPFVLHPSAIDLLRELEVAADCRLLGIAQVEENVIELRASRGVFRHVYLSGARVDAELGLAVVERTVAILAGGVRDVWRRILRDALRSTHGTLLAVLPDGRAPREVFPDACHLTPSIDVGAHVRAYLADRDEDARAAVQGLATLAGRMLSADGITVIGTDGAILAFNAFIAHRTPTSSSSGGARRRTYETLAAAVAGGTLVAAFHHSQDGGSNATTSATLR